MRSDLLIRPHDPIIILINTIYPLITRFSLLLEIHRVFVGKDANNEPLLKNEAEIKDIRVFILNK